LVVLLEVREEDASGDHIRQRELAPGEHAFQVFHHLPRLRLDAARIGRGICRAGERHLAGDEHPAIHLHRVAEGRHWIRRALHHVELGHAHCDILRTE
jgi:hypothetical protein